MPEGQALLPGHFCNLHGLIEAGVSPSAPFLQFLGRVLRVMGQQVCAARQPTNQGGNLVRIAELLNAGLYAHNVTAMSSAITRRDGAHL
jgi:hypothetical protein